MRHVKKGAPYLLPLLLLLSSLYFIFPGSTEPSHRSTLNSLTSVEVVADGFRDVRGIAVSENDLVYLADREAGTVIRIEPDGTQTVVATSLDRPTGLAFDLNGRLLIVERGGGRLLRLEADGSLTLLASGMNEPRWIAIAEDGKIYLTARAVSSDGGWGGDGWSGGGWSGGGWGGDEDENEVVLQLSPAGGLSVFAGAFERLRGILAHGDSLFAAAESSSADDNEGIFHIPILPEGTAGDITRLTQQEIDDPVGLARDRLGALYVSAEEIEVDGRDHEEAIGKVASDGTIGHFASNLDDPQGLAFDQQGNLYLADGRRLLRFLAPQPPAVDVPAFINESSITVTGATDPDSRIDAFLNDSETPTTIFTADGSFSLTLNLEPESGNSLSVFSTAQSGVGLTSAPAEFSIVHDAITPIIANLVPVSGAFLNNPSPEISASFSDGGSGVDASSVLIRLDGFDVTAQANVTASGFTFTPLAPLSEGSHSVSVFVADLADNGASVIANFTIDIMPPAINNLTPADGAIVSAAQPVISADFSDNLAGVNVASVQILVDGVDRTAQANITGTGFTLDPSSPSNLEPFELSPGQHTVFVSVSDIASNTASATSTFTVFLGPQLDPIGDKVANVGSTLSFTVSATDPTGGAVTFSVTPLPLPENATFNALTGLFTFSPGLDQIGSFDLTFIATSNGQSDSETITITVPQTDPAGITAFTGRVLDANDFEQGITTPVIGATISFLGTGISAITDSQGNFTLSNLAAGSQVLDIDTATADPAPDGSPYGGFREELELIAGVNNIEERPFFLPRIAVSSLTTVDPNATTVVTNTTLGVTLIVPPNTAKGENGNDFTGQLSISEVPRDLAPAALPEFLDPGLLITIQPVGVTFSTPAPITFSNSDNLTPGSLLDLWSLDANAGIFAVVGTMQVSADGSQVNTISGGIRAADWHAPAPPPPPPPQETADTGLDENQDSNRSPTKQCNPQAGSTVALQNGCLGVEISLPSYRSLGISRSVKFIYKSDHANPKPVIPFNATTPVETAVPQTISYSLSVGGVEQGTETFVDTSGLSEDQEEFVRVAASFDASLIPTGVYPRRTKLTSNYFISSISSFESGQLLVINEQQSPLGAGWGIDGLSKLHFNSDGSVLLTMGDGTALVFSGGPDTFTAPEGDFSTLIRNPDGTFTRTLKDGTRTIFDSQGLQTSEVDRNGNTTSYSYDASQRLVSITDPAGLVTTFAYAGNLLSTVTGSAGRTTTFEHDSQGNLTKVIFPDTSSRSFGYDSKHLMTSETNERGFTVQREFDSLGRFVRAILPDGSIRSASSAQSVGFVDPSTGLGTITNPAPVVRPPEALNSFTDGNGNQHVIDTRRFGAPRQITNSLGQVTLIERDENGNPIIITRPNGNVLTMTYDSLGNLLTSTDPVGATTTFTYEPNFNQVTSIRDPKGNLTTINYDLNDNPTEIIDALGNTTQMTYDSRGLLLSVTSAVGAPEQNTTSFAYDARSNLLTTTDPLLNTTTLEYDTAGNVIKSTDAEGRVTEFTYDALNRLISVLDPDLKVTRYTYDEKGNLTEVIDAKSQTTAFAYNEIDRLISATNPLGLTETFAYDANGNLVSTTNRKGETIGFDYDALNRLITKTLPPTSTQVGPQVTSFSYDSVGNLTGAINPAVTLSFAYDSANRLGAVGWFFPDLLDTLFISYDYDLNGNRTSMEDPEFTLTTYTYDALNRLTSLTNPKGQTTTFTYDALGRRTSMTHANGAVTTYNYDAASQLLNLSHQFGAASINAFSYSYDKVGNRKTKADNNGTANYTYDTLNRLVQAVNPLPSNPLESFMYDPVGNRIDSNQNGLSVFNQTNQLLEDADFTYAYDNNGNLIQKTDKITGAFALYEYDAESKLVRVVLPNGDVVKYEYDALGRRVEKKIYGVGGESYVTYVYDSEDILLEIVGLGPPPAPVLELQARYTHGPGIDEPLIVEKDTDGDFVPDTSFFYHADGLGSITELTNAAGTVVQGYTYSSFGKIESQLDPNFIQPYTFTSREFDQETGTYFYRARYYEPSIGRFLSEDPKRSLTTAGLGDTAFGLTMSLRRLQSGYQPFVYAANDPVNLVDPDGQIAVIAGIVVATVVGIAVYAAVDTLLRRAEPSFRAREQAIMDAADGKPGAEQRAQRAQEEVARAAEAAGQFCVIGLSAAPTPLTSPAP